MKKIYILLYAIIFVFLVGCGKADKRDKENKVEEDSHSDKKILAENYTGEGGYIIESNVFDYSQCFATVYEWIDGVKLPFEKPDNAKIEFKASYLQISEFKSEEFENYLATLEEQGYTLEKYEKTDELYEHLNFTSYWVYKENIVVLFQKAEGVINVFVTVGNVVGKRSVTAERVIEMLGEEYSDSIVLEIAYESVYAEGYCEFIVIPPEYFSLESDRQHPYYVIADSDGILLCESGLWNQVYPMTVVLLSNGENKELYINYNDLPWSRSGALIYPGLCKYELKGDKFVEVEKINLTQEKVIIGKLVNGDIKYYEMKANEDFDIRNGRRTYWILDKEYNIEKTLID